MTKVYWIDLTFKKNCIVKRGANKYIQINIYSE